MKKNQTKNLKKLLFLFFQKKNLSGFSLLEVIISMFIFGLMMVAVVGIFGSGITSFRYAKNLQRDLENAQMAINTMAKFMRSSSIFTTANNNNTVESVDFFDYSQNKCFKYEILNGKLQRKEATPDPDVAVTIFLKLKDECGKKISAVTNAESVTTGYVSGKFNIVPSKNNETVGKATIALTVKEKKDSSESVTIQSSVSLRDFIVSGVK